MLRIVPFDADLYSSYNINYLSTLFIDRSKIPCNNHSILERYTILNCIHLFSDIRIYFSVFITKVHFLYSSLISLVTYCINLFYPGQWEESFSNSIPFTFIFLNCSTDSMYIVNRVGKIKLFCLRAFVITYPLEMWVYIFILLTLYIIPRCCINRMVYVVFSYDFTHKCFTEGTFW